MNNYDSTLNENEVIELIAYILTSAQACSKSRRITRYCAWSAWLIEWPACGRPDARVTWRYSLTT